MFLVLVSSRSDSSRCSWLQPGRNLLVETQLRSHGNLLNKVDESFCFLARSLFQLLSWQQQQYLFLQIYYYFEYDFCFIFVDCVYIYYSLIFIHVCLTWHFHCVIFYSFFCHKLWHVLTHSEDVIIVKLALKRQQGQPNLKTQTCSKVFNLVFVYIRCFSCSLWILILFWFFCIILSSILQLWAVFIGRKPGFLSRALTVSHRWSWPSREPIGNVLKVRSVPLNRGTVCR